MKKYNFTDPTKPAKFLIFVNYAFIVSLILSSLACINETIFFNSVLNGILSSEEEIMADACFSDLLTTISNSIYIFIYIPSIIIFYVWQYRAAANAQYMGIPYIDQKPHWGFWNYIIPFWSLYKPYKFMKQLWNCTEHFNNTKSYSSWKDLPAPLCIKIWWGTFLISSFLNRISQRWEMRLDKNLDAPIESYISINHLDLFGFTFLIVCTISEIIIVRGIMNRQIECFKNANNSQPDVNVLSENTIN